MANNYFFFKIHEKTSFLVCYAKIMYVLKNKQSISFFQKLWVMYTLKLFRLYSSDSFGIFLYLWCFLSINPCCNFGREKQKMLSFLYFFIYSIMFDEKKDQNFQI